MKVEETIQTLFDNFSILCNTRENALIHMFCMFGTGFEWVEGELVNTSEERFVFNGTLDEKGIAIQRKTEEYTAIELAYNSVHGYIKKEEIVPIEKFIENLDFLGQENKEKILKPSYDTIKELRNSMSENIEKLMCKKYSPIYNIPKNIQSDWNAAYIEVKKYCFKKISKYKLKRNRCVYSFFLEI